MALSPNVQSNAYGVINQAAGYFTTDAAAATALTFTVGFQPRMVRVINVTDRITNEWYEGMAAASAINTVAAGTRTLATTGGITVNVTAAATPTGANSFTIPATMALASKVYQWECYG